MKTLNCSHSSVRPTESKQKHFGLNSSPELIQNQLQFCFCLATMSPWTFSWFVFFMQLSCELF